MGWGTGGTDSIRHPTRPNKMRRTRPVGASFLFSRVRGRRLGNLRHKAAPKSMGKSGKALKQQRRRAQRIGPQDDDPLPSSAYDLPSHSGDVELEAQEAAAEEDDGIVLHSHPCKFHLYQISVQAPKGDISYMLKFFLTYVGGRTPLHLQEDFCGTALLSTEWLRGDPRRTAVGLDLDLEALTWCLDNNLSKIGSNYSSRLSLFHGNVLKPLEANPVQHVRMEDLSRHVALGQSQGLSDTTVPPSMKKDSMLPPRDIICAFNYSCCCLLTRADLLLYFKNALHTLSKRGGIFAMDLYGGTSSEHKLLLRRRYHNFTYIWEQADFDVLSRKTKISLHFQLGKKTIRNAFSYDWRLWSLPEVKDCMEEAGFQFVHFWVREMPDSRADIRQFSATSNVKYEELSFFEQTDSWNAFIVGVAK